MRVISGITAYVHVVMDIFHVCSSSAAGNNGPGMVMQVGMTREVMGRHEAQRPRDVIGFSQLQDEVVQLYVM